MSLNGAGNMESRILSTADKEAVLKMAGVLIRTYVGGYIARGDYYDKYAEHPYRDCCIRDAFTELLRRKQNG